MEHHVERAVDLDVVADVVVHEAEVRVRGKRRDVLARAGRAVVHANDVVAAL
jgi:hypothetical protein